jgi:hypothetical protein
MSYFISSMPGTRLERDAAGVEGDALADQDHRRFVLLAAVVLQDDELRRLFAAARHGQEAAHLQGFELLALQDFDVEAVVARQLLGGVGQVGRGADVRRQVAQFLGQVHAVGDGLRLRQHGLDLRGRCRDGDGQLAHAGGGRILLALLPSVRNSASLAAITMLLHGPGQVALFHILQRECDNGILRAQRREGFQGCGDGAGKAFLADGFVGAHAHQQHAGGGHAGHAAQQQGGAGLAGDVTRLDGGSDLAVQDRGLWRPPTVSCSRTLRLRHSRIWLRPACFLCRMLLC